MYREDKEKSKLLGIAGDYYRVRVLNVYEELPADLEWQKDVLYRASRAYPSKLKVTCRIQVLTQDKTVHEIANLSSRKKAKKRLRKVKEDLRELTKTEFDEKYKITDTSDYSKDMVSSTNNPMMPNTIYFTGLKDTSNENL